MLYRTMSEGRPATRIRSALPIATFVSVCGIGRTIFGDSKAVPHVVPRALRFPAASPSEPLKPSMGAAVRDHRNAVRDRSESLSAINRNTCPQSPESARYRKLVIRNPDGSTEGRNPREADVVEVLREFHDAVPLLRVIRAKCIDCSGGSESEARKCTAIGCALWPYRMASNPFRAPREMTQEQR